MKNQKKNFLILFLNLLMLVGLFSSNKFNSLTNVEAITTLVTLGNNAGRQNGTGNWIFSRQAMGNDYVGLATTNHYVEISAVNLFGSGNEVSSALTATFKVGTFGSWGAGVRPTIGITYLNSSGEQINFATGITTLSASAETYAQGPSIELSLPVTPSSISKFRVFISNAGIMTTSSYMRLEELTLVYNTITSSKTLSSIAVTTQPTKTTYSEGDSFDPTGMVITATYDDSSTEIINNNSLNITPNPLTIGTTEVTVSYTEGDTTRTTTIGDLTVSARPASTSTTVTLSPSNMIVGGGTSQATATPNPPEAAPTYTWTSSNPSVATVNSTTGVVTPVSAGTTNIIATPDDGGATGQATLTVRASTIVINEVYGGGGNTSAPFTHDFVELYNLSSAPISLNSFSIQYTSSAGTTWTNIVNLSGTILAQGYYLIQLSSGGAVGSALSTPDITGSISMSGTAGKVALVNSITALIGANPVSDITVLDFVGFGTANAFEGTGATVAPSNTKSVSRKTLSDTNSNINDFELTDPSPKNSLQGFTEQFLAQTTNKQGSCNSEDLNWNFLSNNFDSLSGVNQTAFSTPGSYQFGVDALERYTYLINQVDGLPDFEDSEGNPIPKLGASRIPSLDQEVSSGTDGWYLFLMAGFSLFFFSLYIKKRSLIK
jgi:uncharacterized protein YjdB